MKKIIIITSVAVLTLIGCNKEIAPVTPEVDQNDLVTYTIKASLDPATKAAIDASSGTFSWSEAGEDQIAIYDKNNDTFVTFTSTDADGNFSATGLAGADFDGQVAYYPASVVETGVFVFPNNHANIAAAAKAFPMTGTVASNAVALTHIGSLIKVSFTNVPSFTTKLILSDGTTDITVAATPTDGALTAVVPIPADTYALTAKLVDDNSNEFYVKTRASKTYEAAKFYNITSISLGRLLTFKNEDGWTAPRISIWNGDQSYGMKSVANDAYATYPWRLNLRNTNEYYCLVSSDVVNNNSHNFGDDDNIGVWFGNDTDHTSGTQTNCVYLYRDLDFVIADGGIKTNYRIYWDNGTKNYSPLKAFVWLPDEEDKAINGSWPGTAATLYSGNIYYYTFDTQHYGKNVGVIFNGSEGSAKTGDIKYVLNREYKYYEYN